MSFMKMETKHGKWFEVEDSMCGRYVIPADLVVCPDEELAARWYVEKGDNDTHPVPDCLKPYCGNIPEAWEIEVNHGWRARLSAPGYMDCTDWSARYDDEIGARLEVADMHQVCPECGERESGEESLWCNECKDSKKCSECGGVLQVLMFMGVQSEFYTCKPCGLAFDLETLKPMAKVL